MDEGTDFPTFECAISNTKEEYDSEVENYFTLQALLKSDMGLLIHKDAAWRDNYVKILEYLTELGDSIIFKRGSPNIDFLKDLMRGDEVQDELADVLIRAKDDAPAILIRAQARTRDLMTLYVKMSRVPRFAPGFTVDRFRGLQLLRKVLFKRAVVKSKS